MYVEAKGLSFQKTNEAKKHFVKDTADTSAAAEVKPVTFQ